MVSQSHYKFPLELQNLCPTVTLAQCEGSPYSTPDAVKDSLLRLWHMDLDLSYCIKIDGNIHFA